MPTAEIEGLQFDYRTGGRDLGYVEWLSKVFVTLPSIAVYRVNGSYILADGKYRLMAAELLGLTEIECRIYEHADRLQAVGYGAAANAAQGLPLREWELENALGRRRRADKHLGAGARARGIG